MLFMFMENVRDADVYVFVSVITGAFFVDVVGVKRTGAVRGPSGGCRVLRAGNDPSR